MLGCIEDSEKAAEALPADSKLVEILHSSFDIQFQELKEGQDDILACLMQQSVILQKIADIGEQVEKTSIEGFKNLPV